MKIQEFIQEMTEYWPRSAENKTITKTVAKILHSVPEGKLEDILLNLQKNFTPSKPIGVYELNKAMDELGITQVSTMEEKYLVECDCCGNRFEYSMGVNDNCGLCSFPYEWTKTVVGYRVTGGGTVPKTIEEGYHKKLEHYRAQLKRKRAS